MEVVEQMHLNPYLSEQGWDSANTTFESEHFDLVSIESLRALLRKTVEKDGTADTLLEILAQEADKANIQLGIRRDVISKMQLRDQPILDKFQSEIFRLPLDQRLLILGPPGTGKTTTLIKRLGQKLDSISLLDHERNAVDAEIQNGVEHRDSWLMFTPTELLKQYLKEAFANEHIPAPDQRLKTWEHYRRELGKNIFPILKGPKSRSNLIFREKHIPLQDFAMEKQIEWFEDFQKWQHENFITAMRLNASVLSDDKNSDIANYGKQLDNALAPQTTSSLSAIFLAIAKIAQSLQDVVEIMRSDTNRKIDHALHLQMNRDSDFLEELGKFTTGLQHGVEPENDDGDDTDDDDDDETIVHVQSKTASIKEYRKSCTCACASARKKAPVEQK